MYLLVIFGFQLTPAQRLVYKPPLQIEVESEEACHRRAVVEARRRGGFAVFRSSEGVMVMDYQCEERKP